jgi:hypothetical protein
LKALNSQLGGVLASTIKEELERVIEEDQVSQVSGEVSLFDPRGPGAVVQGDVALDVLLPGVPTTTL